MIHTRIEKNENGELTIVASPAGATINKEEFERLIEQKKEETGIRQVRIDVSNFIKNTEFGDSEAFMTLQDIEHENWLEYGDVGVFEFDDGTKWGKYICPNTGDYISEELTPNYGVEILTNFYYWVDGDGGFYGEGLGQGVNYGVRPFQLYSSGSGYGGGAYGCREGSSPGGGKG